MIGLCRLGVAMFEDLEVGRGWGLMQVQVEAGEVTLYYCCWVRVQRWVVEERVQVEGIFSLIFWEP